MTKLTKVTNTHVATVFELFFLKDFFGFLVAIEKFVPQNVDGRNLTYTFWSLVFFCLFKIL